MFFLFYKYHSDISHAGYGSEFTKLYNISKMKFVSQNKLVHYKNKNIYYIDNGFSVFNWCVRSSV